MFKVKQKLHEIIFEADTPAGKIFDVSLIVAILLSVVAVMLESMPEMKPYSRELYIFEWVITTIFTLEYLLRIYIIGQPLKYARSFFGIVDLLAILPTYISLFVPGTQSLSIIRILRVVRVFRVFKLVKYLGEAKVIKDAMLASRRKILVFMLFILTLVVVFGSVMYLIEGPENGFDSIPHGIYWAIVTLTTVGYGDITPHTNLGKFVSSLVMIMGYAVIAVPTGIVTAEFSNRAAATFATTESCPQCSREGHASDAQFCKYCGAELNP